MKAYKICHELGLKCVTGESGKNNEIKCGYVGDLLSWVMGKAQENCVWVTVQGHINVIAVSVLVQVGCIIIAEGSQPTEEMITRAKMEGIPIYLSDKPSFEVVRDLIKLGI